MGTRTETVEIGTIDLSALCDCPSPCDECCLVDACGCATVPQSLSLTYSSVECPGFAGSTTLTYNSGDSVWRSPAISICDSTVIFEFYCQGGTDWVLQTDVAQDGGPCATNGIVIIAASSVCDPFQADFDSVGTVLTDGVDCSCCTADGVLVATVTE